MGAVVDRHYDEADADYNIEQHFRYSCLISTLEIEKNCPFLSVTQH